MLVRHLPAGSAIARAGGSRGWDEQTHLLADLWELHASSEKKRETHPHRPKPPRAVARARRRTPEQHAARARKAADARRRIAASRAAKAAQENSTAT